MHIAHASDLHGQTYKLCHAHLDLTPDVWIFSGDLFPNSTRGVVEKEVPFQTHWFQLVKQQLMRRLGGSPVLWVGGNHDYVNLADLLNAEGYDNAWDITRNPVDIGDERFGGISEVPWMAGEWAGESKDLRPAVERVMAMSPTVLVSHAPPAGILDNDYGAGHGGGIQPLTSTLLYGEHRVHTCLFGHIHAQAQTSVSLGGIHFRNGACGTHFFKLGA